MGFLKNVGKGVGKILKGDIKTGVNTVLGNGSSGTSRDTQAEATAIVTKQLVDKWLVANKLRGTLLNNAKALSAVTPSLQTSEVKAMIATVKAELDSGKSAASDSVASIANTLVTAAVTGVASGLTAGLGTQVNTGITKLGEQIFGSKPAASIKDQLGSFLGGVVDGGFWDFIKKNWYLAIPFFGFGIWVLVKLIQLLTGKSQKRGKSGVRQK